MRTYDEHLEWCKRRAREYLDAGDWMNACTSMGSDLSKHPEARNNQAVDLMVMFMANRIIYDVRTAREFIEGFR